MDEIGNLLTTTHDPSPDTITNGSQYTKGDTHLIPYDNKKPFGGFKDPERHFDRLPPTHELHFNARRHIDEGKEAMRHVDHNPARFPKGSKKEYLEKEFVANRMHQRATEAHHRGIKKLDPYDTKYEEELVEKEKANAKADRKHERKDWLSNSKSVRKLRNWSGFNNLRIDFKAHDDYRDQILNTIYKKKPVESTVSEQPGGSPARPSEAGSSGSKDKPGAKKESGRNSVPHDVEKP